MELLRRGFCVAFDSELATHHRQVGPVRGEVRGGLMVGGAAHEPPDVPVRAHGANKTQTSVCDNPFGASDTITPKA